ncbi:MAG TPA: hypothetical protein VIF15_12895 [Polyangiaceae bacterium]
MRTATLIVRQQRHIHGLLQTMHESPSTREEGLLDAVDAVTAMLLLEDVVLRSGLVDPGQVARHQDAHTRARLALFRIATAAVHSAAFCSHLLELDHLFGERVGDLARAVERTIPSDRQADIDREFDMLHLALTTSRNPSRIANAASRCSEALRACA